MDKERVVNYIIRFRNALEGYHIRADKIILYGSWANQSQHEGSDIDIVVISKDFEGKGFWERIDILSEAIYTVFAPIEAIAMTPEEFASDVSFVCDFAKDGEVIAA